MPVTFSGSDRILSASPTRYAKRRKERTSGGPSPRSRDTPVSAQASGRCGLARPAWRVGRELLLYSKCLYVGM